VQLGVRLIGGATATLEFAGLHLLTDPTFDPPGEYDRNGYSLTKTSGPAAGPDELGPIDAVLLSHDHHPDNLDRGGRAFLPRAGRVLTTAAGAERLGGNAIGLEPWQSVELERPGDAPVTVTALPAQHGPDGTDHLTGPVIGFALTAGGVPSLYVSGDNASVDVVRMIADRFGGFELAVLFAGGAQVPPFGDEYLTLSSQRAVEAALSLGARAVVALHLEGWRHFSQGPDSLRAAFDAAGVGDLLVILEPGRAVAV
jgi:L-ascorbate metabolism protein UlaG (beta-lactamase superfamily)